MERIWPSDHFCDQWRAEVGEDLPSPEDIGRIISESVRCQRYRDLFTPRGHRYRVLAAYWHPARNLVLKIDERDHRAVTVLTPKTRERRR